MYSPGRFVCFMPNVIAPTEQTVDEFSAKIRSEIRVLSKRFPKPR